MVYVKVEELKGLCSLVLKEVRLIFGDGVDLSQLGIHAAQKFVPLSLRQGCEPERGKAVPGSLGPALTKHPHALLCISFPGGGASLCFKNMTSHIFYSLFFPSTQNGSSVKAEEKLLTLFTAVSLAATGTWDIVGDQYLIDRIKD